MRCGVSSVDTRPRRAARTRCSASPPMTGADLSAEVTTPRALPRRRDRRAPVHRRRARLRHQVDDAAPDGRARHHLARAAVDRVAPTTSLATGADAVFLANGPGDPATADAAVATVRELLRREVPVFGICFGNQILGRAFGFGTYKLGYGHRGINQPVQDRAHRQGRDHRAQPRLRRRRAARPRRPTPSSARSRSATSASTTTWSRACAPATRAAFSVQYHPEAAAGPHDAAYLFDRFVELLEGTQLDAQAHRHRAHPGHRLRADRHRPGLRVRLLRHPGLPGAAQRGLPGQPGQLQPGDDHDRPRVRRRHLHRAAHPGVRRAGHRASSARTRCCRPWAGRPRSTSPSRCTTPACWRSTASS